MNNADSGTAKSSRNRGCLIPLIVALFISGGLCLFFLYEYIDATRLRNQRIEVNIEQYTPQAVEIFERNKEHLDVLVNGEFIERSILVTPTHTDEIARGEVPEQLEELLPEEVDAIVFLLADSEPENNFGSIGSGNGNFQAALNDRHGAVPLESVRFTIIYGDRPVELPPSGTWLWHVQSLDDRYDLWIEVMGLHHMTRLRMEMNLFWSGAITAIFLVALIVAVVFGKKRKLS